LLPARSSPVGGSSRARSMSFRLEYRAWPRRSRRSRGQTQVVPAGGIAEREGEAGDSADAGEVAGSEHGGTGGRCAGDQARYESVGGVRAERSLPDRSVPLRQAAPRAVAVSCVGERAARIEGRALAIVKDVHAPDLADLTKRIATLRRPTGPRGGCGVSARVQGGAGSIVDLSEATQGRDVARRTAAKGTPRRAIPCGDVVGRGAARGREGPGHGKESARRKFDGQQGADGVIYSGAEGGPVEAIPAGDVGRGNAVD
jgi:hypothetical protein